MTRQDKRQWAGARAGKRRKWDATNQLFALERLLSLPNQKNIPYRITAARRNTSFLKTLLGIIKLPSAIEGWRLTCGTKDEDFPGILRAFVLAVKRRGLHEE